MLTRIIEFGLCNRLFVSLIGLGVLALMVALCVRLYERYGTFDVTEIRRLRG